MFFFCGITETIKVYSISHLMNSKMCLVHKLYGLENEQYVLNVHTVEHYIKLFHLKMPFHVDLLEGRARLHVLV